MRRLSAALIVLTLAFAVSSRVPAADPVSLSVDDVTSKIICDCGCSNLTIKECTCGKADRVRADVRARLAAGQSSEGVLKAYTDEFGEQILAAPTRKGFNLVGWIAPFAALLVGGFLLVLALRRWASVPWSEAPLVPPLGPGKGDPMDPSFLRRVEEEMQDTER